MASRTFSPGAGIRKGLFFDENHSAIDIVAPRSGLFAAIPATSEQMTMGSQKVLRLQPAGVVQGLEHPSEKTGYAVNDDRCRG
jgi:hypothetical protein